MGEGSGSPGPHGDYVIGLLAYNEKTPQRKRDTKKTASEGGILRPFLFRSYCSAASHQTENVDFGPYNQINMRLRMFGGVS